MGTQRTGEGCVEGTAMTAVDVSPLAVNTGRSLTAVDRPSPRCEHGEQLSSGSAPHFLAIPDRVDRDQAVDVA